MVQIIFFIFAVVGLSGGARQLLVGKPHLDAVTDNVFRFMAGIYLGLGLIAFYVCWTADEHSVLIYLVSVAVMLGAAGRIVSVCHMGVPEPQRMFLLITASELLLPIAAMTAQAFGLSTI
ncbi:DUF4345 family protein [Streptomyces sp. NPDC059918]|uniref:DUF4345 family protein n=1 Tax=unclassified Streptomyces TaxID=2593676 RepID=UPI00365EB025